MRKAKSAAMHIESNPDPHHRALSHSEDGAGRFRHYIDVIEQLARGRLVLKPVERRQRIAACLDGEPGQVLRRASDYSRLRQQGAYFTGAKLATKLANAVEPDSQHVYFDPTCGAGDLLLAVAKKLPVSDTLTETIADWGRCLAGCDISPDFVRLTKARLVLLAAKRCRVCPTMGRVVLSRTFQKIGDADFLSQSTRVGRADVVIMNPPFGYTPAYDACEWAQGRISAAATFFERAIQQSRAGTRVAAILPDVLRSGSRYECWRQTIDTFGVVRNERPLGLFDRWTDVDVYLLDFLRGTSQPKKAERVRHQDSRQLGGIGKRFAVHVGPVVPHRHKETGPEVCYIHARSLPVWDEHKQINEKRRFEGRLFQPPFVAVRRTSRPDDRKRAVATLVLGDHPVAVENHLIVLLPKDRTIRACKDLILRLKSPKTDEWINRRLRCRHLTTRVLAGMPWWLKP